MDTGREDVESLLDDHPGLEDDLEEILAIDAEGVWEFADIPLDSGAFGELVSKGIATKQEGGYRINDRAAVRAALGHETEESSESRDTTTASVFERVEMPLSRQTAVVLAGLLALVALFRVVFVYDVVYRDPISLMGNDPYKRLYWVEQLQQYPAFDVGALGTIPEGVRLSGDTLMLVTTWWLSELFGGTPEAARLTLAWYPVAAALITAAAVYTISLKLTDDIRVAGASTLLLAVTPVHAYRTALGFGDHHAFDYIWLVLTVLVVIWWEKEREASAGTTLDLTSRRTWGVVVALTVLLTIQTLSWVGSAIVLLPFGLFVVVRGTIALLDDRSPLRETAPYVGGLGAAGLLVIGVHVGFDWFPIYRAVIPLLVLAFSASAVGFLEAGRFFSVAPRTTVLSGVVSSTVTVLVVVLTTPALDPAITRAIGLFESRQIAESSGLFSTDSAVFLLPVLLFGFMLFLALPFVAMGAWRTVEHRDALWAIPTVYAIYFLLWAIVKIRFAGPLSLFTSIFAGWGLVRVAAWVDLARPVVPFDTEHAILQFERPDSKQFVSIVFAFLLVAGLGIVQTPIKQGQLAVDDSTYETAQWIAEYSDDNGMAYPDNGVFSMWSDTRVYNYFVNGQSLNYGFEQRNYDPFLGSTDAEEWYERLRDRHGFVVFTGARNGSEGETMERRLMANDESRLAGLQHYRLVHTAADGPHRVFELVNGSTLVGAEETNDTVTVETEVIVSGEPYTYRQQVSTNPYGLYTATVPYAGEYSIASQQVTVSESDVRAGVQSIHHDRDGLVHWPFDATDGTVVYDRVSGIQGEGSNLTVTNESIRGSAVQFQQAEYSRLQTNLEAPDEFTVSTWVKPSALDTTEENDYRNIVRSGGGLFIVLEENGRVSLRMPGTDAPPVAGGNVAVDQWHHVAGTYDGREYTLYVNGTRVANGTIQEGSPSWNGYLGIGSGNQRHIFDGTIDEFRIYERALEANDISDLASETNSTED
jgi:dolichyl-diphosphooligosaccharide--protein glycosyltransferase